MIINIIFCLVLVIIIIDIIPIFIRWISRIHIGRYQSIDLWEKQVEKMAKKWLIKTPKAKLTDNERLIIIDMIRGCYYSDNIQYWQQAGLLLGISKTDNNLSERYIKTILNEDGMWINNPGEIDCAILAYAIMKIEHCDYKKYKPAFDYVWQLIRSRIGNDATVLYRKNTANYRYVDTIGMICPFLIKYGQVYENEKCIDLAINQIEEYEKYGVLREGYIPYHAYNINSKYKIGLGGWGRGVGWYALGISESWNIIEDKEKKIILESKLKKLCRFILSTQLKNGGFSWNLLCEVNNMDTSCTAMFVNCLLKSCEIPGIKSECLESSKKALEFLMKQTRQNGVVDFSQGDTKGLGIYSMNFDKLPFTQGLVLDDIITYKNYLILKEQGNARDFDNSSSI